MRQRLRRYQNERNVAYYRRPAHTLDRSQNSRSQSLCAYVLAFYLHSRQDLVNCGSAETEELRGARLVAANSLRHIAGEH